LVDLSIFITFTTGIENSTKYKIRLISKKLMSCYFNSYSHNAPKSKTSRAYSVHSHWHIILCLYKARSTASQ